MYEVELTKRAHREFNKLSVTDQELIEAALDHLSANPRPAGMRKIHGNIYRIRIREWRVIYAVFDKDRLVLVGRIVRRSEDTYDRIKDLF
jgi:mRNA interferase RelE/StbE